MTPDLDKTSNIQIEDVRRFILDNATSTNVLGTSFYFTDSEIEDAMKRAVDAFNALPPLSITMTYGNILGNTMWLNGIAYQLYLSKMLQLQRKDVVYSTGGTQVAVVAKQIEHLAKMKETFKHEFTELALIQKKSINMHRAFASF